MIGLRGVEASPPTAGSQHSQQAAPADQSSIAAAETREGSCRREQLTAGPVGIAYMLKGDKGASNTDPFATAPTATNQWVVSPAHLMVLTPDTNQLAALPTDPHNGGPWVMWKGTKYAHIMVPTVPMPANAAERK